MVEQRLTLGDHKLVLRSLSLLRRNLNKIHSSKCGYSLRKKVSRGVGTYQSKRAKTSTEEHRTLEVLDNKPRIQGVGYGHTGTPRIVFPPRSTSVAKKRSPSQWRILLTHRLEEPPQHCRSSNKSKGNFGSTNQRRERKTQLADLGQKE